MENRTSARIAAMYLRKEGPLVSAEKIHRLENGQDRRALVWKTLKFNIKRLGCEKYLVDAAFKWILDRCWTRQSIIGYADTFARWLERSGRVSLSSQTDVSPRIISQFLYDLEASGLSARYISRFRDVLRSWYGWLADRELIRKIPLSRDIVRAFRVDHGRIQRGSGLRQALTRKEAQAVADWAVTSAAPVVGFAVILQMVCGLRSHEVANLKKVHLVEKEGVFTLAVPGKGGKLRTVVLEDVGVQAYQRYVGSLKRNGVRGPLLVGQGGVHFGSRTIQRWAKMAAAVVGREHEISSHDLRRTAITLLMERGARLEEVQRFAGHSSPVLTARCYVVRQRPFETTTGIFVKSEEASHVDR